MTSDTSLQFLDPFSGSDDRGPLPPDASFIGAWDLDAGIDTLHEALFLFRSERQDLLWTFTSWSAEATGQYLARRETGDFDWASKTISCGCVAGLPRQGSASDSRPGSRVHGSLAAFSMSFPGRPGRRRHPICDQAHACTGRWPRSACLSPAALGGGIAQRPGAATNRLRSRSRAGSQHEGGRGSAARGRGCSYHSTCEAIEALANSGRNQRTRLVSQLSRTRARAHAGAAHQPVRLWILPSERGASESCRRSMTYVMGQAQRQYDGLARRLSRTRHDHHERLGRST